MPWLQEARDQRKEAAAEKKVISEQKPRPSAAKALFPISKGGNLPGSSLLHIYSSDFVVTRRPVTVVVKLKPTPLAVQETFQSDF